MLDTALRVRSANRAFYQTFHVTSEETENWLIYELGNGQWDIPALRNLLEDIIPTVRSLTTLSWQASPRQPHRIAGAGHGRRHRTAALGSRPQGHRNLWDIPVLRNLLEDIVPLSSVFNDFEWEHDFPVIGRRVMLLNARKLQAGHHGELLVLAMEDVTERRRSEADLKAIETYAQNIVDTVREPLLILDTTLRVRSANRAFYQTFRVSLAETENRLIYELGNASGTFPSYEIC